MAGGAARVILVTVLMGVVLAAGVVALAHVRWQSRTSRLVERVDVSRSAARATYSVASDLDGVPVAVQRYFRTVLRDGQPLVRRARFRQEGEFLIKPERGTWVPFAATQDVGVAPPAFVWDARMRVAPGVSVRVRDAFAEGRGYMHASLLATVSLVAVEGTPGIAFGALQRYLAEAAWYPTALLPSQGIAWTALGEGDSARATLTAGGVTVSLDVHFGVDGLIESVYAADRPRHVDGRDVPTPWQGHWFEYGQHDGMRIPQRGEVAWLLPEGPQVYWRGRVTEIHFE